MIEHGVLLSLDASPERRSRADLRLRCQPRFRADASTVTAASGSTDTWSESSRCRSASRITVKAGGRSRTGSSSSVNEPVRRRGRAVRPAGDILAASVPSMSGSRSPSGYVREALGRDYNRLGAADRLRVRKPAAASVRASFGFFRLSSTIGMSRSPSPLGSRDIGTAVSSIRGDPGRAGGRPPPRS